MAFLQVVLDLLYKQIDLFLVPGEQINFIVSHAIKSEFFQIICIQSNEKFKQIEGIQAR